MTSADFDVDDIPERIKHNDGRLEHMAEANDRWEEAAERLAEDWATLSELISYYESDWRDDVENFPGAEFGVLSEDGVWNEMGRFYQHVKAIAETSAEIVREYEASGDHEVDPGLAPGAELIDEP